MTLLDEIETIHTDRDFAGLFSPYGQLAVSPWRLVLICVMQFIEDLTDRQAGEAVRSRIDWKYALSLELSALGGCVAKTGVADGRVRTCVHSLLSL